jgi:hypothetical protein
MAHREMRCIIKMNFIPESVHDPGKFYRVPVIFRQVLFQENENELLVLGVVFFDNWDENRGILESQITPEK